MCFTKRMNEDEIEDRRLQAWLHIKPYPTEQDLQEHKLKLKRRRDINCKCQFQKQQQQAQQSRLKQNDSSFESSDDYY